MQGLQLGAASVHCVFVGSPLCWCFQLCDLHMHFHRRIPLPDSPTCIQGSSRSLSVREAISHSLSKSNILYVVFIWPIAIGIK